MPDVREVYEMVTKQKPPEPGALQRQQKRQVRTARNRKVGAFAIAAAIGLAAVVDHGEPPWGRHEDPGGHAADRVPRGSCCGARRNGFRRGVRRFRRGASGHISGRRRSPRDGRNHAGGGASLPFLPRSHGLRTDPRRGMLRNRQLRLWHFGSLPVRLARHQVRRDRTEPLPRLLGSHRS